MRKSLKPCPLCGGEAVATKGVLRYWIECIECQASSGSYDEECSAVMAWNFASKKWRRCTRKARAEK